MKQIGAWFRASEMTPDRAAAIEDMGYGAMWTGGTAGDLELEESLLAATDSITVATGIVNIWRYDAASVAAAYHRIEKLYPGRFLLGIGISHPEAIGDRYSRPMEATVSCLDELDALQVPMNRRVLAALGPRMLKLSAERTAGAHPYLTVPEHTRQARALLGPGVLLAPEQKVVLESDPERARAIGRPFVDKPYLHLVNYTNNLRSLGYTDEDLADGGSDRLIDALAVHGDVATVAAGITAHLAAGADHVGVHVLVAEGADPLPAFRALAGVLPL